MSSSLIDEIQPEAKKIGHDENEAERTFIILKEANLYENEASFKTSFKKFD